MECIHCSLLHLRPFTLTPLSPVSTCPGLDAESVLLAVAVVSFIPAPVRPGVNATSVQLTTQPPSLVGFAAAELDERELAVALHRQVAVWLFGGESR